MQWGQDSAIEKDLLIIEQMTRRGIVKSRRNEEYVRGELIREEKRAKSPAG